MRNIFFNIVLSVTTCLFVTPTYSNNFDVKFNKILKSDHRSQTNKARDKFRNPKQTLEFFGLKPDTNVMEITPGKGWYTEIIAPFVMEDGTFNSVIYEVNENSKPYFKKLDKFYRSKLKERPDIYKNAKLITIDPKKPKFNLNKKVDMVLTFRNVHNWAKAKSADSMFKFFFSSLKSGGVFGVVEHRALKETPIQEQIRSGYMTEKYVIELAQQVGFEFISSSEINSNPKDTKKHSGGVWTLLPNLRGVNESEKVKYSLIGESDRMTLKFLKP